VPGLMLRILKSGKKSFSYRYNLHGKKYRYPVGLFDDVTLAEAREKVRWVKSELRAGRDPQNKQADPKSFAELSDVFKDKYLRTLRDSTATEYRRIIDRELVPAFGGYQIEDISKHAV